MATTPGLPRLEIPRSSGVPVFSPLVHSAVVALPPLSPVGEESQLPAEDPAATEHERDEDSNTAFLSAAVSPTYVDSQIPPAIRTHIVSPLFHSRSTSTSSAELVVPGPAASPLLGQEFERPHSRTGFSAYSGIFSPRSFRSVSTHSSVPPSPRVSSPPSATALSASQLYPPLQTRALRPKARSASGSTTVMATPAPAPRHSLYYLPDEMVIFEVEGYLYRVSMNLLEKESDYFRRLLVRHSQAGMYGKTDGMPIPLVDLERSAFDCILRFLHFSVYEPDTISLDEWISLLSVSTLLQFARIRRWAIREITAQFSSLDAATVIVLATKHDVPQWLAPAYSELCRRREPLDDSEAEELGAVTTARVGRAREAIRDEFLKTAMCEACASGTPWDSVDHEPPEQLVTRIVDRVFWPEQS